MRAGSTCICILLWLLQVCTRVHVLLRVTQKVVFGNISGFTNYAVTSHDIPDVLFDVQKIRSVRLFVTDFFTLTLPANVAIIFFGIYGP